EPSRSATPWEPPGRCSWPRSSGRWSGARSAEGRSPSASGTGGASPCSSGGWRRGEPGLLGPDTPWTGGAWHATGGGTRLDDVSFQQATAPEVCRPRPVLPAAMGTAALLWLFVLVYLMTF